MRRLSCGRGALLSLLVLLAAALPAQTIGPDIQLCDFPNTYYWGSQGTTAAFSIGTTSVNLGDQPAAWFQTTPAHPVISQTVFKLDQGRFRQIGMSWVKHGLNAVNGTFCGPCQSTPGTTLGVGCSDPYGAQLNGGASLGPRSEINPFTGVFPFPFGGSSPPGTISRRIQLAHAEIEPLTNVGARYFCGGQYVAADDSAAGNQFNNESWREIDFSGSAATNYFMGFVGPVNQAQPAIFAWRDADPQVVIAQADVPGEGRFYVAHRIYDLGGGIARHEFAVQNLNSDRALGELTITLQGATTTSNVGFSDVSHHSNEPYDGTDWGGIATGSTVTWNTQSFQVDPNANALRWGTVYNFWFDSDGTVGDAILGLHKPGTPTTVTVPLCPPPPATPPLGGQYTFDPNGPFDPVAISGNPGPSGNNQSTVVPIGFSFPFYNTLMTQVRISTNGYLCRAGQPGNVLANTTLPSGAAPQGVIAGLWDHYDTSFIQGGAITYATVGVAPNRRFVANFAAVRHAASLPGETESFQIVLCEDGDILSTIIATTEGGAGATRGVASPDGSLATLGSFDQVGSAVAGTTWRWLRDDVHPPFGSLTVLGNGAAFSLITVLLQTEPLTPFTLMGDLDPGPTSFGPFGTLDLGFGVTFLPIVDGVGLFGPVNPLGVSDVCGAFATTVATGPGALPSGLMVHLQAITPSLQASNGLFHVSPPATLSVP